MLIISFRVGSGLGKFWLENFGGARLGEQGRPGICRELRILGSPSLGREVEAHGRATGDARTKAVCIFR